MQSLRWVDADGSLVLVCSTAQATTQANTQSNTQSESLIQATSKATSKATSTATSTAISSVITLNNSNSTINTHSQTNNSHLTYFNSQECRRLFGYLNPKNEEEKLIDIKILIQERIKKFKNPHLP